MPEDGVAVVFSAARMAEIEAASIVEGEVDIDGNLQLKNFAGTWFNAGHVVGPQGDPGPSTGVSTPTASSIMARDSAGRSQVVDPAVDQDIATKVYVDTRQGAWGTSSPTVGTMMRRDGAGRSQVEAPSAAKDIVNKTHLDTALALKVAKIKITRITATGTTAYTPDPKMLFAFVRVKSPGGGSGGAPSAGSGSHSASGGGGGGACGEAWFTAAEIAAALSGGTITVTVGTAGAAGTTTTAGGNGGTTSFGALIVCTGGGGSAFGTNSSGTFVSRFGAVGGTPSGTATNLIGRPGQPGDHGRGGVNFGGGGNGGASGDGSGGGRGPVSNSNGVSTAGSSPAGYGGGAGGCIVTATGSAIAGTAGAPAIVEIVEYLYE